jgi:ferredoxin--NADP+ reductase
MPVSIAIIGAGPSGFYAAEAVIRSGLPCLIDIIEALPNPFGLIRSGVAPDHQHTKRVTRSYERTALDAHVAYFGNVQVGRDVGFQTLRRFYDAVIVAIGAPLDWGLKVPGGETPGVYGSAAFVGWYNGHPDHLDLAPRLDHENVAVIGHGNVALDVARVLVKTPKEMAGSDLPDYASRAIHGAPIRNVTLFGRRGPAEAKFTIAELRELARLKDCLPVAEPDQLCSLLPEGLSARDQRLKTKNIEILRKFAAIKRGRRRKTLTIAFYSKPLEVLGEKRVTGVRFERTRLRAGRAIGTGETYVYPCGTVIAAIGTHSQPVDGLPFDERRGVIINRRGRVAKGVYVVGWAGRGAIGVIGSNKSDADLVAAAIAEDVTAGRKPGRSAMEEWLEERHVAWVSYADWKAIEAVEIDRAQGEAPRKKLYRIKDMLSILDARDHVKKAPVKVDRKNN